jgi:hypothetical protein
MDHGHALRCAFIQSQGQRSRAEKLVGWLGRLYRAWRPRRVADPLAGLRVTLVDGAGGLPCVAFGAVKSARRR